MIEVIASLAKNKLINPGPAISTFSILAASLFNDSTIVLAISRGFLFNNFVNCIAKLVE